jgi:hypothetical protein
MTSSRNNFCFHLQIWQGGAESAQRYHVMVKLLGQDPAVGLFQEGQIK